MSWFTFSREPPLGVVVWSRRELAHGERGQEVGGDVPMRR